MVYFLTFTLSLILTPRVIFIELNKTGIRIGEIAQKKSWFRNTENCLLPRRRTTLI